MKKLFFLFALFTFFLEINASHIVGGDFKITMLNNGTNSSDYEVQLRLFRDDINGIALPNSVTIGVYEVGTNNLVTCLDLIEDTSSIVQLGNSCYTPDPNYVRVEEKKYISANLLNLQNYSFGYYLHYENCCRNALSINLSNPTSEGVSIFAIIPDPSIGQNSSPDLGPYPNNGYFCINEINKIQTYATDPDGDDLVFSVVPPLTDPSVLSSCSNSAAGSGNYPFYPVCGFSGGFSSSNLVGGPPNFPAMSMDYNSGIITASPTSMGFYSFGIRVEEYRNGAKIGEVRREVQFSALPCAVAQNVVTMNSNGYDTSSTYFDLVDKDTFCLDLEFSILDPLDTLNLDITSPNFYFYNYYVNPNNTNSGPSTHFYENWQNTTDTIFFNQPNVNGYNLTNMENIIARYCIPDPCSVINLFVDLDFSAYYYDCSVVRYQDFSIYLDCSPLDNSLLDFPNVSFYPNPSDNIININLDDYDGDIESTLYNLNGEVLETFFNSTINLGKYPKGIYILSMKYNYRTEKFKLLKK